jgi:hypothetical protein
VYLVSALFALAFIAWIERVLIAAPSAIAVTRWRRLAHGALSFVIGLFAGASQEQAVAACFTYLALVLFRVRLDRPLGRLKITSSVGMATLGLVAGAATLVSSPGNFTRMEVIAAPGVSGAIERMVMYVPGAFFDLGTGAVGKNIWLGALVFFLLYFRGGATQGWIVARLTRGIIWLIISLSSLLAMTPATNFISPRTSFFAVVFLFIGLAAITCNGPPSAIETSDDLGAAKASLQSGGAQHFAISTAVLMILGCLFVVDAIVGLISNVSVAAEFIRRDEIVERAMLSTATEDTSTIRVPFIATETSTLTFVQTPEHDRAFLENLGNHIGRKIEYDVSKGAPLPNSYSPLKAIKFRRNN